MKRNVNQKCRLISNSSLHGAFRSSRQNTPNCINADWNWREDVFDRFEPINQSMREHFGVKVPD